MEKQTGTIAAILFMPVSTAQAQLQRGNVLVGADLANIGIKLNEAGNLTLGI